MRELVFAEFAVDVELFRGEFLQHLFIAAAVGFSDGGAELSLAAFEMTML
jgi:hypothetical protein